MKLSNTMTINESLLPAGKKAFTLAEVLITLSILGVVAAITIPSLVNRNSDIAALVKLKKAVSNYEDVSAVYMVENEVTDLQNMMGDDCGNAGDYFKIVSQEGCVFTTSDGVQWTFDADTGFAYAQDNANSPRYGVTMWALNGQANGVGETDDVVNVPSSFFYPATSQPLNGTYYAGGTNSITNLTVSTAKDAEKAFAKDAAASAASLDPAADGTL